MFADPKHQAQEILRMSIRQKVIATLWVTICLLLSAIIYFLSQGEPVLEVIVEMVWVGLAIIFISLIAMPEIFLVLRIARAQRDGLWWRSWCIALAVTFALLVPAHVLMSYQLNPIKREFYRVAATEGRTMHATGETVDGQNVVNLDYSGRIDEVTDRRNQYLIQHQYLPYIYVNGKWEVTTTGATTGTMVYIYTYLPKTTFDKLLIWATDENSKNYHRWIDGSSNTEADNQR